jgi:Zn-dependent metalloprotease
MACRCAACITPPHLLKHLLGSGDAAIRAAAMETLLATSRLRGERAVRSTLLLQAAPTGGERTVFDCGNGVDLSRARMDRRESDGAVADASVNRAFDGLGATRDFFRDVLGRNSIDGFGMRLDAYVHYDRAYNNAFWDGKQMVFGDGDQVLFTDFTGSLDVIGHELAHGVTEYAAGLVYSFQPGALNESISDVFGSLVKQWTLNQAAEEADWLIGADIFTPGVGGDALRSMRAPGTAYDSPTLGTDPQPDHMSKFREMSEAEDNGGVHINSGIPNRAFYLAATGIGGFAWEAPGHIWYEALLASNPTTQFLDFAETTVLKAGHVYGPREQQAVREAWREVGVAIGTRPALIAGRQGPRGLAAMREEDTIAELQRQVDDLAKAVRALTKEVSRRKGKGTA